MKRFVLVLLSVLMVSSLCGCGDSEKDKVVIETPVAESEMTRRPITFLESHEESLRNYLSECSYMVFSQTMENGIQGEVVYSTTRYSISVNTEQKIQNMSMKYIVVNGASHEGVGFNIYSDGETTLMSEDGVWVEAAPEYGALAWDLDGFDNALDVFDYLLNILRLPVGVEGYDMNGYWTFEWTLPATVDLFAGLEYDDLLEADYKFTFRERDYGIIPDSFSVNAGYVVDDVNYYVKSTIQINSVGNTGITMPAIGSKS